MLCCLASNVFQQFQLLTDGSLKKTFSSLKYLQLSGSKDQTFVLELDCKKQVLLNASDIIFWLMDWKSEKRLDVQVSFSKKQTKMTS